MCSVCKHFFLVCVIQKKISLFFSLFREVRSNVQFEKAQRYKQECHVVDDNIVIRYNYAKTI